MLRQLVDGLLHAMIAVICSTTRAHAQGVPQEVRFLSQGPRGDRWQGRLERLTRDSLYLRVRGSDTVLAFSRLAVDSVERSRLVRIPTAVAIGCVAVGGALGALGYFGTHDPDSPGLEKTAGAVGLVVGCGVGAIGGLIVSAVRAHQWEPWTLPEESQSSVGPP